MPPAATATGVVTTTPDGAEDGHTSSTTPARLAVPRPVPAWCRTDEPPAPHPGPQTTRVRGQHQARRTPLPRAPKICANASCIALVTPPLRYCPEHKTSGWARSPRTASADRTNTRAWKMQRVRCLQRDGRQCQIRGPRCTVTATQVDHITPVSQGGSDELSNLRAVCVSCHAVKTAREARDARL